VRKRGTCCALLDNGEANDSWSAQQVRLPLALQLEDLCTHPEHDLCTDRRERCEALSCNIIHDSSLKGDPRRDAVAKTWSDTMHGESAPDIRQNNKIIVYNVK
jgi:hypothetical protein